eukprot:SAG22_NODE_577_length_8975_cov_12.406827_11_plen_50_part_00
MQVQQHKSFVFAFAFFLLLHTQERSFQKITEEDLVFQNCTTRSLELDPY